MKEYKFSVSICGGWCNGHLVFEAENEEAAYEDAMDYVVGRLMAAFPELDMDYDVECQNPDDESEEYIPSAENGDYSPSNPWDSPGYNVWDFI